MNYWLVWLWPWTGRMALPTASTVASRWIKGEYDSPSIYILMDTKSVRRAQLIKKSIMYCMSKSRDPFWKVRYLYKISQNFLDRQYENI